MAYNADSGMEGYGGFSQSTEGTPLVAEARVKREKVSKLTVLADGSVYGALLYLPPVSRLTRGSDWGRSARLAVLLCIMNAMIQLGVVRVLDVYRYQDRAYDIRQLLDSDEVIERGPMSPASESMMDNHKRIHKSFLPAQAASDLDAISDIEPLCKRLGDGNGTFTCMPHSVKFTYEWEHLDIDNDGVWTKEEAHADVHNLKGKLHISPETIFNNLINGLKLQAEYIKSSGPNRTLFLSSDIINEKGVAKAYFHYWKGDTMMCALFDSNSCEAAAKAGIFEAALVPGRVSAASKGIHDLDSAIQYCYRMLSPGGGCENSLPTDFKRNREQRWGRCGDRTLSEGGKYTNPYDPDQSVHILEASYQQVNAYTRATSRLFLFFLMLVITVWLYALLDEWRELIKFGEFLFMFPTLTPGEEGGRVIPAAEESDGDEGYRITAITQKHRWVMVLFYVIRVLVACILTGFGTGFLLDETDYLALVMNSLALTFILSIDSMLFGLMEKDCKDAVENCKNIEFVTRLPTKGCLGYSLKKECWGLFLVPVLSIAIVFYYNFYYREPLLKVLRCACTQEGDKCLDSIDYMGSWWQDYWTQVLPAAMHQIEALRVASINFGQ